MQTLKQMTSYSSQVTSFTPHFYSLSILSTPSLVHTVMPISYPHSQDVSCSRVCVRAASASDSLRSAPWCWGSSSHTRCKMVLAACTRSMWFCRAAPTDSLVDKAW